MPHEILEATTIAELLKDKFASAYLEAGFWSSTDDSSPDGGENLDKNYSFRDVSLDLFNEVKIRCALFLEKYQDMIVACDDWISDNRTTEYSALELAGHDFWLTSNGHGAGFWETGRWPQAVSDILDKASREFGSIELYVGDDKQIYCYVGKNPTLQQLPDAIDFQYEGPTL